MVVEEQRLGATLALVVAAAGTDRIDTSPVVFGLGMHFGIAVDLAGRSQQEAGACRVARVRTC